MKDTLCSRSLTCAVSHTSVNKRERRPQPNSRRYSTTGAGRPTSPLYPLAHLGLARAAALSGDTASARKAYQDFFALWKDADPDPAFCKRPDRNTRS